MKGITSWSYRPYKPLLFETGDIYICRIYPYTRQIGIDWLPLEGTDEYTVCWRVRGTDSPFEERKTSDTSILITGLEDDTDYEIKVVCGDKTSRIRLARTGFVPGDTVVNYLHPDDPCYSFSGHCLCSPSIVRHPDGHLLASMDVFQAERPQDLTLIFRSDDDGATWKYVCELYPCFWGKLFIWKGAVYILACSTEYGDLLIGRSDDGGYNWCVPTVLFRGSSGFKQKGIHKNPQKIMEYNGRLWTTLEWGSWASGTHAAMCMSIDTDADLLKAENWHFTPPVPYDPTWKGAAAGNSPGCIEGSITVFPDGNLYNVMRYQMGGCQPSYGRACVMRVNTEDPDAPLEFDRFIDFPGNHSKFEITYDEQSKQYISIVCYLDENHPSGRNLLSLIASKDAEHWYKVTDIFDYTHMSEREVGFQYISFIIEGDDILFLSRTAFNHAFNHHDANYSVFSRIKNFRELLK